MSLVRKIDSMTRRAIHTVGMVAIITISAATPQLAISQDASAIFQRAAAQYNAAATLKVEFEQTLTNALTGATSTARGELLRKKPNLFSINFSDPAEDRIVNDGKAIWLYLPSTAPGQVIKIPLQNTDGMMVDPLGHILSSSKTAYNIKLAGQTSVNGVSTRGITLTPKSDDAAFTSATIWIGEKDSRVHRLEVKEPSGLQRKIVVKKYTEGVAIPASAFQFKVPPKVRVVDQKALMGNAR